MSEHVRSGGFRIDQVEMDRKLRLERKKLWKHRAGLIWVHLLRLPVIVILGVALFFVPFVVGWYIWGDVGTLLGTMWYPVLGFADWATDENGPLFRVKAGWNQNTRRVEQAAEASNVAPLKREERC